MKTTNNLLQVSAIMEKIETRRDNTIKLIIGTQELGADDEATLMRLRNKLGYFLFKETPIEESDILTIPEAKPEFKTDKTPSQRLRAVIYLNWKDNTGQKEDFNTYYAKQIEYFIEKYKEKLE